MSESILVAIKLTVRHIQEKKRLRLGFELTDRVPATYPHPHICTHTYTPTIDAHTNQVNKEVR